MQRQYEKRMDVEGLVERAVAGIMITEITPQAVADEVDELIEGAVVKAREGDVLCLLFFS